MKYIKSGQLMRKSKTNVMSSMLKFGSLLGLFFAMTLSSSVFAQQYKKMTRVGTSQSVCTGGVETEAQMQDYFANNPDAIRAILADSGWTGSADDLLAAVANGDLVERSYPVGTKLAWTGAKVNGQYIANDYREWAGTSPLETFQLNLSSGCQVYEIAIPKACCNVSLVSVSPDNSVACNPPVAAVAAAPVVAAPEPEPEVSPLALIPFFGAFVGSETRPRFESEWQMDLKDSSGIIGLRAGLMKELSAKTAIFGQVSYYDRQGINEFNVYPENNFGIDLGVERRLTEKAFIGGGIGAWNVDDSDFRDASLFGLVGGDIGKSNLQWFLEGRVFDADSQLDSISDNKMFSAGVRYLVK